MYDLISASPSPYARKVRIQLQEKGIPFNLQVEVPWDSTTRTPEYNPLEKLPILIGKDGKAVYESHHILEYIETKHPKPALLPSDVDERLFAKQVEVVADGICDALVLCFFENKRDVDKQSEPWKARQMRKVDGGLRALATWVEQSKGQYLINDQLTLADIAVGSCLGWMALRWPDHHWRKTHPQLEKYWLHLEERESFANTRPSAQDIKDRIV